MAIDGTVSLTLELGTIILRRPGAKTNYAIYCRFWIIAPHGAEMHFIRFVFTANKCRYLTLKVFNLKYSMHSNGKMFIIS